jgi:hypothetical protein
MPLQYDFEENAEGPFVDLHAFIASWSSIGGRCHIDGLIHTNKKDYKFLIEDL